MGAIEEGPSFAPFFLALARAIHFSGVNPKRGGRTLNDYFSRFLIPGKQMATVIANLAPEEGLWRFWEER